MLFLLLSLLPAGEPSITEGRAQIIVHCPAGTSLNMSDFEQTWQYLDKREDKEDRDFLTPILNPYNRYGYCIRVRLPDGKFMEKKVVLQRGQKVEVSFP